MDLDGLFRVVLEETSNGTIRSYQRWPPGQPLESSYSTELFVTGISRGRKIISARMYSHALFNNIKPDGHLSIETTISAPFTDEYIAKKDRIISLFSAFADILRGQEGKHFVSDSRFPAIQTALKSKLPQVGEENGVSFSLIKATSDSPIAMKLSLTRPGSDTIEQLSMHMPKGKHSPSQIETIVSLCTESLL